MVVKNIVQDSQGWRDADGAPPRGARCAPAAPPTAVPASRGPIAEIGDDRTRFPCAATLLAEAGLAPVTRSSGRTRQVRFRYAANKRLRHAIDWWMIVAAREDPWTTQAYDTARAAGQGRYRAYRGLGARWTRILWRAWVDHAPYDPQRAHHQALVDS